MTLGENICYFLNQNFDKITSKRPVYHNDDASKYSSPLACQVVEYNRGDLEWNFFKDFIPSLDNKRILDAGCGFGGRSVHYALKNASVIGIDIKPDRFKMANEFARHHGVENKVVFQVADASALPFDSNSFDIVISNNAMQYIARPVEALNEFKRVVKPGGLICVNFGPPWLAPICPETGSCFPWTHIIFSQESIRNSFVRMGKGYMFINSDRDIFKYNNKLTIRKFRELLNKANYDVINFKLWTRPYVAPFLHIPILKEYFCAQIISIAKKSA